jgi:hypothetical protein
VAFLPSKDRKYLLDRGMSFEEVSANAVNGLIFQEYRLPQGLFDHDASSLLIILPGGYPDLSPDMFFLNPWVRLVTTNQYARCADQAHQFNSISWQRWSRHNTEWRRGKDGIWTMLKRVEHALLEAK